MLNEIAVNDLLKDVLRNSMTIEEKREFYSESIEVDDIYIQEWKSKKNLVDDKTLKVILEKNKMNEKEFNFSISPIEIEEDEQYPEWLNTLKEILECYNPDQIKGIGKIELANLVFPFIEYTSIKLQNEVWKNSEVKFSEKAVYDVLLSYAMHILGFIDKNIVIELEIYKNENEFQSEDKAEQFEEFIKYMFENKDVLYSFYSKYAVSTRLMTVRTEYFIENIKSFVNAINDSQKEIIEILDINEREVKSLELSAGDSHEKGKGVIIVKFENEKLAYKPKNLDVCEAYENFLTWVNEESGLLDLTTPKGIYKDEYALIGFAKHKPCESEEEVKRYYERFGYTLALGHVLCMTDMHLENIIANGEYPVIIDGETMLQNSVKLGEGNNIMEKFRQKFYMETILATAMLPNTARIDKDLDLSALAGDEQKSKKKYLSPVNSGTSDYHYEERELIMEGSNNIPVFNGQKVNYKNYLYCVIDGFNKMIDFFYENKARIMSEEYPMGYFKDKKIRFITKSTQRYNELLMFLTHPSTCTEMSVRERVLQNIWAYPHFNKEIILSEYKDMLFNDIPIFYTKTDSKSLFDSYGNEYQNYFEETGYNKIISRIRNLDESVIDTQKDVLLMHLGLYDGLKKAEFNRKNYTYDLKNIDTLYEAEKIAKKLIDTAIVDDNNNISWPYVGITEEYSMFLVTGVDLYEGITGIAVFFLELYHQTKKQIYFDYYYGCIKFCAPEFDKYQNNISAFGMKYSVLTPIVLELKLLGNSKFEEVLHKAIEVLSKTTKSDILESNNLNIDWISGISGMLALILDIHENVECISESEREKIESVAKIFYEIIVEKVNAGDFQEEVGQAHGYSGIALGLAKYFNVVDENKQKFIKNTVKNYLRKEKLLAKLDYEDIRDKWCRGLSGMIISRIEILKYIKDKEIEMDLKKMIENFIECQKTLFNGDGLCHGNSGTILTIKTMIANGYDSDNRLQNILNKMISQMIGEMQYHKQYKVLNTRTVYNPTLFSGNAGVGYMLLKLHQKKNHNNILTLS